MAGCEVSNPRHSKESVEWYTPTDVIEAARASMGEIDLDPASSAEANDRVRARCYFTREANGLSRPWFGRVFLNPPGAEVGTRGHAPAAWWAKLASETIEAGVFVIFNLETLRYCASLACAHPCEHRIVWPAKRLRFVRRDGSIGASPAHGNAIVLVGACDVEAWREIGRVTG